MDDIDPFKPHMPVPTSARPLLGLTVLAVEDSRFACEALRLLCLRSGARIRRADSLRAARRHLQVYRPTVVIIDLGLPDGNGIDLIEDLVAAIPRPDVIIGTSGDNYGKTAAMDAGADGFFDKPITSLGVFQSKILSLLPADRRPDGPRRISMEEVQPDPIAFQDDMAHVADVLEDRNDDRTLDYVAQFLSGVARSAKDGPLQQAAEALAQKRAAGQPAMSETAILAGLVHDRMTHRMAI
ncbi:MULTISPECIES: response regulator [Roseobacteraceae]|jgi:CheY-like chemotaxis protein|uniref:KDP operon transcriptional regulatory protein KdpE n=1 Tax=Pseudosulfitobacter pseudonitzschiae TaxID=1402135 RepID=A0A221JVV7_9RHOB|nr:MULTISPECIES: response regulator [Roseobacteraceae]ASM70878.1 KDP operon transcriptional regulatory protein KdpE [Pseudosulfitobacter pseudonitzschiae]